MNYIICHYHEIGLKGKNRAFFENKLVNNIKRKLNSEDFKYVKRISGRIIIKLTPSGEKSKSEISQKLKNIFGISHFSFAASSKQTISAIKGSCYQLLKPEKFTSFRISTQRSNKKFSLTSQEVNEKVGAFIVQKLNKKVNLNNPGINCFIEIVEKYVFIYLQKISGPGGLPVGASGKAIVLLSGGIDSPVAAYFALKRGIKCIFVHFHAYPFTDKSSLDKTEQLVKILSKFQNKSRLYLVPFGKIQEQILTNTPAKLRVNLYRRIMVRISEKIARKEKCETLITGESVGQVASQTLTNLKATQQATDLLILRPLIGFDKQEIINKAKQINTYSISILPHADCCARFLPKHPAIRVKIREICKAESKIDLKMLTAKAVNKTKIKEI